MSTLKVNKLRDTAGSADAITLDPNGGAVLAGVTTVSTVKVGSGVTISSDGDVFTTGITTSSTVIVGSGVTISESGIEASGIGITCANINGGQIGGRRNVLFNGAMQVHQRGTSFTNVGSSADTFTMDRWKFYIQNSTARFTVTEESESPDEFGGSMKIDCTTADTSLASTDEVYLEQRIEGQDLQHFKKGTSSAKQYTLSFYAKTNKTGTYIVNLLSRDNTTGTVSASYTVSDTNWNRYVITFPADTNSNRKDNNDNGEALRILWWFVAGSAVNSGTLNTSWANSSDTGRATGQVNFSDSTSNDFYLTGCQLEVGPQASVYEHRSFGEELSLCQRYYYNHADGGGSYDMGGNNGESTISENATMYTPNNMFCSIKFPVQMRAKPTLEVETGSNYYISFSNGDSRGNFTGSNTSLNSATTTNIAAINNSDTGSSTGGYAAIWRTINTAAKVAFTAEL